jgi:hypothetical protein
MIHVNLEKLSFRLIRCLSQIRNIKQNARCRFKGTINLANLKSVSYKVRKALVWNFKDTTKSTCNHGEKSVRNINNAGTMSLSGFQYADENGKTMNISTAVVQFNLVNYNN